MTAVLFALLLSSALAVAEEPNPAPAEAPGEPAEPTDPIDLYNLGVQYYRGETVERDVDKAAEYWRKAADNGHINAHNGLAYLVFYGRGAPRDPQEGLRLWRFAAERGHAESQFHLASAYMAGREVDRDYVVAHAWVSAAVYYSKEAPDLGGGPKIHKDATALLGTVTRALPASQTEDANARAQKFIRLYGPRE